MLALQIARATPLATVSYVIEEALAALFFLAILFAAIVCPLAAFIFLDEARVCGIGWMKEGKKKLAAAIHDRLKPHGTVWRKAQDSKLEFSFGASPSSVSSAQHPGTAGRQDSPNAGVSQGIKIKGEISGHGDLFLDGEFEGKIRIDSGTLTVGPNARVRAEIEAPEIIVRGDVIGTLKGRERVHIWSTGKLIGDIETRGIVIDDGALLCGTVAVPQASVREGTAPEVSLSEIDHPPQPSSPEPPPRAKGASA